MCALHDHRVSCFNRLRHRRILAPAGAPEPLERRVLLAAPAEVIDGVLTLIGTDGRDAIIVEPGGAPGRVTARVNGVAHTFNGVGRIAAFGGPGNDNLELRSGLSLPALLDGGPGGDHLTGGGGTDTLEGAGGGDLLQGGGGNDTLNGGDGNDILLGNEGNDAVSGGRGDDSIQSDAGADRISGGEGIDWIGYMSRTADLSVTIDGAPNDGEAGEGDNILVDVEDVHAGSGDDTLVGSDADNYLEGGEGDDRIFGRGGNDQLSGHLGSDLLDGGEGNDTLTEGGWGDDRNRLIGGSGDDRLSGLAADVFDPGPGLDAVNGQREDGVPLWPQNHTIGLYEAEGYVYIEGTDGNDTIRVVHLPSSNPDRIRVTARLSGEPSERVVEFPVVDVRHIDVEAGAGDDIIDLTGVPISATVEGRDGNDTITGGDGNDLLRGYSGNDVIRGGPGDDTLVDETGANTLDGGPGRDVINGIHDVIDGETHYEAELGSGTGVQVERTNAGYTGSGYIDYGRGPGDFFELAVPATAGPHVLTFRYANGGTSDRAMQLSINGRAVGGPISFLGTGSWTTWGSVSVSVTLVAGPNVVRLTSTTDPGGPNVDSLTLRPAGFGSATVQAESAMVVGPRILANHTGYTGSGFADYQRAAADLVEFAVDLPTGGNYALDFRYANGSASDRPLELRMDGEVLAARLSFPPTGAWSAWETVTKSLPLTAGRHTVRLTAIGSSGPNLDALTVRPVPEPPHITPPRVIGLSVQHNDVLRPADATITERFSEPMKVSNLSPFDVYRDSVFYEGRWPVSMFPTGTVLTIELAD